jgi:hypothetical protein
MYSVEICSLIYSLLPLISCCLMFSQLKLDTSVGCIHDVTPYRKMVMYSVEMCSLINSLHPLTSCCFLNCNLILPLEIFMTSKVYCTLCRDLCSGSVRNWYGFWSGYTDHSRIQIQIRPLFVRINCRDMFSNYVSQTLTGFFIFKKCICGFFWRLWKLVWIVFRVLTLA